MTTGQLHAEAAGEVAITNSGHRTLLHLLRTPDEDSLTICGRWTFAAHTGQELVSEDTPRCQICFGLVGAQ